RKVKFTEALLVAFLITGGIAGAEETVSKAEFDALSKKVEALEKYKVKFVSVKVDKEGESVMNSDNKGAVGIMSTAVGPSAFSGQDYSLSIGNYVHNCGKFATQIGSMINLHQLIKKHTKDGSDVDTRGMFSNIVGSLNWMYLSENGEFMGDVPESELVDGMDNTIVGSLNYTLDTNGSYILGSGNIVKNSMLDFKELVLKSPAEEEKSKETFPERLKKYRIDMKEYGGKTTIVGKGNEINGARRTSIQGFNNKVFGDFTVGEEDVNFPDDRKDKLNKAVENILIMGDNHKLTKVSNAVIVGSSDKETETTVSDIVAVGHNTQVKNEGGIALGNGSTSATDKGKQGFDVAVNAVSAKDNIAWKSTRAALS
ncbi:Hep/Hag repeat protein, partial [Fusobacterium equinum]